MADEFDGQQRAARAFASHLAEQAGDADFPTLDPTTLVGEARQRRRRRPALIAAVAAIAVVIAGLGIHRAMTAGMPAEPAGPSGPSERGAWQRTAPIPIGQRYGSVNLWADDAFYVIGGHRHCGLDDQGRPRWPGEACRDSLPSSGGFLADGARYDPAADSWQRIADAPTELGRAQGVVAGDRLYLTAEPREDASGRPLPSMVVQYDPSSDTWTELAQPADSRRIVQLLSWQDGLYATVAEPGCPDVGCPQSIQRWNPETSTWELFAPSHPAVGHGLVAVTRDGFAAITDSTVAFFSEGEWTDLSVDPQRGLPLSAAGQLSWAAGDQRSNLATVLVSDRQAYVLRIDEAAWESVAPPPGRGGLASAEDGGTPWFTDGVHVVVDGQLYDPLEATWTEVPPLPNPRWSFGAFASSGSQVLACYVGPEDSFNDCHLLTLDDPTVAPPASATGEWRTVAPSPLTPRGTSIATWVGAEYLIVGGSVCAGEASVDPENGDLDCTMTAALDAAAYNPATDQWRAIAAPPVVGLADWASSWAVLHDILYLVSMDPVGMWSYDPVADHWQELPLPPGGVVAGETVAGLIALNDVLLALAGPSSPDSWFDPATGIWTELPAGTYPNAVYPNHANRQVVFTGKELLVGEPEFDDDGSLGLRISVFDLDDDGRLATRPSTRPLGPVPAGRLVANALGTVLALPADNGQAFYRIGGGEEWLPVPASGRSAGILRSGVVAGEVVALDGNLFSPRTGSWRSVALPAGLASGGFVQAGGPDAVLFCFGLTDTGDLAEGCQLLRV